MTTPEPRTRRCQVCGYRFVPDGDEMFCPAICPGQVSMASVVVAMQRFARGQAAGPAG